MASAKAGTKCSVCEESVQESFNYCPKCGCDLSKSGDDVYVPERLPYVLGRYKHGNFLFKNFRALDNLSRMPWLKVESLRPELGNFAHSMLLDLNIFSFLYLSPKSVNEVYSVGQFVGYSSVGRALTVTKFDKPVSLLSGTGLFWKVFEFKPLWKQFTHGWKKVGSGIIQIESVDKEGHSVEIGVKNSSTSIISSKKPLCVWYAGILSGQIESFFPGYWSVVEEKCSCSPREEKCVFKLTLCDAETTPTLLVLSQSDLGDVLDQLTNKCVNEEKDLKGEVGDFQHIMMHQATNFPLLSSSPGHAILVKQGGCFVGEQMAEKKGISGVDDALDFLEKQFLYLKAGLLETLESSPDKITLRVDESVYSSGVNNINMKLDTFLAGIIEGALCEATHEKWSVNETRCLANGDEYCEFVCKKQ